VVEGDRGRIAAVFATDADLEFGADFPPALDTDAHQFADALLIDRNERIGGKNPARGVDAKKARRIVP
jgi:hypothetical protein